MLLTFIYFEVTNMFTDKTGLVALFKLSLEIIFSLPISVGKPLCY